MRARLLFTFSLLFRPSTRPGWHRAIQPNHRSLPYSPLRTAASMADVESLPTATASHEAVESTSVEPNATATKMAEQEPKLPPLSAQEFRMYNHMADGMEYYHSGFRQSWTLLYKACENNARPAGMSITQYLRIGEDFCSRLTLHHNIEEAHIFPILAQRMPAFREEMEMKTAHKSIHAGLEKMEAWLKQVRSGERELVLKELKAIMDLFGAVLWEHLDEEVQELRAENMRKYWTAQEVVRLPM